MAKSVLLLLAGILVALAPARMEGGQESAPAPAQAAIAAAPAQQNPVKPTAESQAKAKTFYQIDCAVCHGDNGNGKTDLATSMSLTLTDWTDPKSLAGESDGELFKIIRNGKGTMPPEDPGRAKDDTVWNLVIYIRNFSKPQSGAAAQK
ncbi:MAG: cytochrome c [Terracidiphilus sp.]|jgi:mono/diheme cytochrome c family protein